MLGGWPSAEFVTPAHRYQILKRLRPNVRNLYIKVKITRRDFAGKFLMVAGFPMCQALLRETWITLVPRVEVMIEEDVRDRFNQLELRLERFDAAFSQIEKWLSEDFTQMSAP